MAIIAGDESDEDNEDEEASEEDSNPVEDIEIPPDTEPYYRSLRPRRNPSSQITHTPEDQRKRARKVRLPECSSFSYLFHFFIFFFFS